MLRGVDKDGEDYAIKACEGITEGARKFLQVISQTQLIEQVTFVYIPFSFLKNCVCSAGIYYLFICHFYTPTHTHTHTHTHTFTNVNILSSLPLKAKELVKAKAKPKEGASQLYLDACTQAQAEMDEAGGKLSGETAARVVKCKLLLERETAMEALAPVSYLFLFLFFKTKIPNNNNNNNNSPKKKKKNITPKHSTY